MNLDKFAPGQKIVTAAGILLLIDLLFLPWHKIDLGILSLSRSGIESPNAIWGVLAFIGTIVMVAQIIVTTFTSASLPEPPLPWGRVHLIVGVAVLAFLVVKLLADTDFLAFGAYLGILLAAVLAFGGFTLDKESRAAA